MLMTDWKLLQMRLYVLQIHWNLTPALMELLQELLTVSELWTVL
jgi:hypothetical protein